VISPGALRGTWSAPDYGVSAIAAAWLGAVACVFWRRRGPTITGKAPVAISCLAVAVFAWMLRRHLNPLDSEHALAFAIGLAPSTPSAPAAGCLELGKVVSRGELVRIGG